MLTRDKNYSQCTIFCSSVNVPYRSYVIFSFLRYFDLEMFKIAETTFKIKQGLTSLLMAAFDTEYTTFN